MKTGIVKMIESKNSNKVLKVGELYFHISNFTKKSGHLLSFYPKILLFYGLLINDNSSKNNPMLLEAINEIDISSKLI